VEKRAEVHLKWRMGRLADHDFAVLHRLDYQVWDAWLKPVRLEGARVIDEPPELLTRNGVSYEMALAAVVEAMGDEMPEGFGVLCLRRPADRGPDGRAKMTTPVWRATTDHDPLGGRAGPG
jgi:hypothetical protein